MPYTKPGVEVTQVERSASPVLITPELPGVVIGQGAKFISVEKFLDATDQSQSLTIGAADSTNTVNYDINALLGESIYDSKSVVVVLIGNGKVVYIPESDSSVSVSGNVITINDNSRTISGVKLETAEVYTVAISFLAKPKTTGLKLYTSVSEVINDLGEVATYNPLGYATKVAMDNSGMQIYAYNLSDGETYSNAFSVLTAKNMYAIAIMSGDTDDAIALGAHCATESESTKKHERIGFASIDFNLSTTPVEGMTSTERIAIAGEIYQAMANITNKRLFVTYPSYGYVKENRHVSTLFSNFVNLVLTKNNFTNNIAIKPKLAATYTGLSGMTYKEGTKLTDSILNDIIYKSPSIETTLLVYVPVPGAYYAAGVLGAAIRVQPQQPLTNMAISGVHLTYGSFDLFTDDELNTMAENGLMIMVQDSAASAVYVRHQLSTDTLTIQRRELSITHQVDYVAKYLRRTLDKYSGKYVINKAYNSLVSSALNGVLSSMVRNGYLAGASVMSVYQDSTSPDTTRAQVELDVYYPANNIKITLVV